MPEPLAFVSYSHDSDVHKSWVLKFASKLRAHGVDVILDQWDLTPGQDLAAFMTNSITRSDRVLMICTRPYVEKSEAGVGGVGYERLIVTGEIVANIDTKKFVPVIRQDSRPAVMPNFLGPRLYVDFSRDESFESSLEELVRAIHGTPLSAKPPLGSNPFGGTIGISPVNRVSTTNGLTARGESVLDDSWFATNAAAAEQGISEIEREGAMDLRAALHDPLLKSQIELLNGVRNAQIRTFGWPIGVLMENNERHRPKPNAGGISAEMLFDGRGSTEVRSYDYWALRNNGDYYLLQSLFEDERRPGSIFFDTRIVRVTETFLFLAGLYENLGASPDTRVSVKIGHSGLRGRTLRSANMNRSIWEADTNEGRSESQVTDTVGGLRLNIVDHVMAVLSPMFMLFDYKEIDRSVFTDIVTKFQQGKIG